MRISDWSSDVCSSDLRLRPWSNGPNGGRRDMAPAMEDGIARESERMGRVLAAQKDSFTAAMPETLAMRRDRIDRADALHADHAEDFAKAAREDFGHRNREHTLLTDILPSIRPLKHSKQQHAKMAKG